MNRPGADISRQPAGDCNDCRAAVGLSQHERSRNGGVTDYEIARLRRSLELEDIALVASIHKTHTELDLAHLDKAERPTAAPPAQRAA